MQKSTIIGVGDMFIVTNPHPSSSLKGFVKKCAQVTATAIIPEDQGMVHREYPRSFCVKIMEPTEITLNCPVCNSIHLKLDADFHDSMFNCLDCQSEFTFDGDVKLNAKEIK